MHCRHSAQLPLGRVWRTALSGEDRERAFAAAEVATLLDLRRALRNGTVWIEHSLAFRGRETLFIPQQQWQEKSPCALSAARRYRPIRACSSSRWQSAPKPLCERWLRPCGRRNTACR